MPMDQFAQQPRWLHPPMKLGQPAWQPHNAQLNSLFIDPHQQQQPTAPPPQFQGYSIPQPTVPQGLPSFNTLPLHHHNQPIPEQSNPAPQPTTNCPPPPPPPSTHKQFSLEHGYPLRTQTIKTRCPKYHSMPHQ